MRQIGEMRLLLHQLEILEEGSLPFLALTFDPVVLDQSGEIDLVSLHPRHPLLIAQAIRLPAKSRPALHGIVVELTAFFLHTRAHPCWQGNTALQHLKLNFDAFCQNATTDKCCICLILRKKEFARATGSEPSLAQRSRLGIGKKSVLCRLP
jgi:hypothetical protein